MKKKSRLTKIKRAYFVEPLNPFTRRALKQSEYIISTVERVIYLRDGRHRLLKCENLISACLLKKIFEEPDYQMRFWEETNSGSLRLTELNNTNEIVCLDA